MVSYFTHGSSVTVCGSAGFTCTPEDLHTFGTLLQRRKLFPLSATIIEIIRYLTDAMIVCAGCEKPILDKFLMNVLDKTWHSSCVECVDCKMSLTDKCYARDGKLYCKTDFFRYIHSFLWHAKVVSFLTCAYDVLLFIIRTYSNATAGSWHCGIYLEFSHTLFTSYSHPCVLIIWHHKHLQCENNLTSRFNLISVR